MKPGMSTKANLSSLLRRRRLTLSEHMNANSIGNIDSLMIWCDRNNVERPDVLDVRVELGMVSDIPVAPVKKAVVPAKPTALKKKRAPKKAPSKS